MELSEKVNWAREVIEHPWCSTEDEKLVAVKVLADTTSGEAMTLLRKAYLAAGTEKVVGDRHIANGDRIQSAAAQAARALARKVSPEGRDLLLDKLSSEGVPLVLRELALYGLGGVQRSEVWQALGLALADRNPHIRRAAVNALCESFSERKNGEFTSLQREVLEELANIAFEPDGRVEEDGLVVDDGRFLARKIVARHATSEIEEKLADLMCHSTDEDDAARAAEILSSRIGERSRKAVTRCLLSRNRPAKVYQTIASCFDGTGDEAIKSAASKVVNENIVVRTYTRATARSLGAATERLKAGAVILHGSRDFEEQSLQKKRKKKNQATKLSSW